MSYLIYQILKLKEFLMASGAAGIVMMTGFLLLAARPKKGMKQYGWQAMFFALNVRDIWYLAVISLQLLFAWSSVAGQVSIERIHIMVLAALCLMKILLRPGVVRAVTDMGCTGLLAAMLLVDNLLAGFIKQAGRDWWIRAMHVLLCVFIAEFALYYFFRGVQQLLRAKERGGALFGIRWPVRNRRRKADG